MTIGNTPHSYGLVARTLHWLTALLIFAAFPLGYIANNTPLADDEAIARVFTLFSLHKTIGISALLIGIARLLWRLTQPRPAPMPHARWEHWLADVTHWMLTIALIAVPLSGWIAHSASPGLAPIRWPFGQSLPFVPTDPASAAGLGAVHWVFTKLLAVAILLHVAGAMKHALIDRDGTLARMTSGAPAETTSRHGTILPAILATLLWAAALAIALLAGLVSHQDVVEETREWPLAEARITITDATGTPLATATTLNVLLLLAPDTSRPEKGTLDITLPLDAMEGPGIDRVLAAAAFPLLTYSGTISGALPDLEADGLLDLAGVTQPGTFSVTVEPDGARISGTAPFPGAPDLGLAIDAKALRN
ncbi:MAG: cytochrome [Silicimonas sp.]|nr:cytochrome [Silicimonas sp.]